MSFTSFYPDYSDLYPSPMVNYTIFDVSYRTVVMDPGQFISTREEEKKTKDKPKKPFIKSHTDIHKVKASKLVLRKSKTIHKMNQPTQKGARVRYSPVSRC